MYPRLLMVLCLAVAPALAGLHRTGLIYEDLSKTAPEHEVTSIPVAPGAKSFRDLPRVDLSNEIPPVGNQQAQGSCVSWAVAYYHRSQLEYRERHWDLTDPNHQFSPAFVYNQVNGGIDGGSGFGNNMPLICDQGCASLADCRYDQGDCTSWPSESAYSHAIPYRCQSWSWFNTRDSAGLARVKQLLANGSTCALAIWVWGNFDEIARYHNTYCSADRTGSNRGGHGVTIIGYDDTMTTHDGPGAFKLVNSWGPGWGAAGFFWMSYTAVLDTFLSQRTVGYLVDTVGYEPRMLARLRMEHPTRDRVALDFYVGPQNAPLLIKGFRTWRRAQTDRPFPQNRMVFDLTEGAEYVASGQTDSIHFCTWDERRDGRTGTVREFSVQYLPWCNIFQSGDTPVAIPDGGSAVYAGARVADFEHDAAVQCIVAPVGVVTPESSFTPVVIVGNNGSRPASFLVRLRIGETYSDSIAVANLAPRGTQALSFSQWTAPARADLAVRCSVDMAGDEYPANDAAVERVRSRYADVGIVEITAPPDTVDSGAAVRPAVLLRNYGTGAATITPVFRIPDEGYLRAAPLSLQADSTRVVTFALWTPRLPGYHVLSCTLIVTGDMNDTNNLALGGVFVRTGAGVAENAQPGAGFGFGVTAPSPFAGRTEVSYTLGSPADVTLAVYDVTGTLVRHLRRGRWGAGSYDATWDGRDDRGRVVPSGTYLCLAAFRCSGQNAAAKFTATAAILKL